MSPDQITLELEEPSTPAPSSSRRRPKPAREYHCGVCGRRLKDERWIYSSHTGARFCWPGECKSDRRSS